MTSVHRTAVDSGRALLMFSNQQLHHYWIGSHIQSKDLWNKEIKTKSTIRMGANNIIEHQTTKTSSGKNRRQYLGNSSESFVLTLGGHCTRDLFLRTH